MYTLQLHPFLSRPPRPPPACGLMREVQQHGICMCKPQTSEKPWMGVCFSSSFFTPQKPQEGTSKVSTRCPPCHGPLSLPGHGGPYATSQMSLRNSSRPQGAEGVAKCWLPSPHCTQNQNKPPLIWKQVKLF